jgi:tetratricopeptide (TPR) repeat protein
MPFFQRATDRDPANGSAWAHLGWILNKLRRYDEALPALNRALDIDENVNRWGNKAIALRALGRTSEAGAAERRAKELGR